MQKLISELTRLYLPADSLSPELMDRHMLGQTSVAIDPTTDLGLTRVMVIAFHKMGDSEDAQHWDLLCAVANALQTRLGFPAPAVSVSGANGYNLWLSLQAATPAAQTKKFLELLRKAYFPDMGLRPVTVSAPVELPPCLEQGSGRWGAFIHPGMGASFADESGLEMAPPLAGQAAFLAGLHSISESQFLHALNMLQPAVTLGLPASEPIRAPHGLLLADATLEDIVRLLHSKNIEPTFRHLIPK